MQKKKQSSHFLHNLLWLHVISVAGFYAVQWIRTYPGKPYHKPDQRGYGSDQKERAQRAIQQPPETNRAPRISVIVPARNEEQNIRRCVSSLLNQDYKNYEVIVVDDGSTDRTAEILDELKQEAAHLHKSLLVLRLEDQLPTGWAGKPHAIHAGTREATGDWLLLTDADTWHAPNALRTALAQALERGVDMLTLGSHQELPTFWDKVLMPMAYMGIFMLYPLREVNDPDSPVALANGQFILLKRNIYTAIGGYARPELKATLLDDRDLAHTVKHAGYRLLFTDGRQLVSVHMYNSLQDAWKGWRKNIYLGNRGGLPFVLLQLLGLPIVTIFPFLFPLLLLVARAFQKRPTITPQQLGSVTALELGPLLAYRIWLNRLLEVPWYYVFTHPLAGAVFQWILAQSTWRVITGKGVDWRGRRYHEHASQ